MNNIKEHWMEFPDLAAFPEYNEEHRNENNNGTTFLAPLYEAYDQNRWDKFVVALSVYTDTTQPWVIKLKSYFDFYQYFHRYDFLKTTGVVNNSCLTDLVENGAHASNIDISDIDVSCQIKELLKIKDWKPDPGLYDRGMFLSKKYIGLIESKLRNCSLLHGVGLYSGKARKVAAVYLHVSYPTDHHYKQFMEDATIIPRWVNTHIDPKEDVIKAIIYLEDVGPENGGFGFVPKSHRFKHDRLQNIFGRAISTGNYCRTPEQRAHIFSLPSHLRVSFNFGRCVLDDSQLAKDLDDNFIRMTSDMGNIAVFDSGSVIHQGGIVDKGRRVSLQVLIK